MVINHSKSKLQKVSNIKIPEAFFKRMKTGVRQVDQLFGGEGILPGSVATWAAKPGAGKTTFLLQTCNFLQKNGYNTAYITGEESVEMIAYTCKRLGIRDVQVASDSDVDSILKTMPELDFLVYDSFQCLTQGSHRLNRAGQEEAISRMVFAAKKHDTALAIVLHMTKSGTYKGTTTIPHAVDINFTIDIDGEDESIRTVASSKNRYGSLCDLSLYFGANGFDFSSEVVREESTEKSTPKSGRKEKEMKQVLAMQEPPGITVKRVAKELNIDGMRAQYILRALTQDNKLKKFGRGATAIWKFVSMKTNHEIKVQTK